MTTMDVNSQYAAFSFGVPFMEAARRAMSDEAHCRVFYTTEEALAALDDIYPRRYRKGVFAYLKDDAASLSARDASLLVTGAQWIADHLNDWPRFTASAIIEIGRLTPDLRFAAVWRPVQLGLDSADVSDLDWEAVRMAEQARETGDVKTYLALAELGIATKAVFGVWCPYRAIVQIITPQFPKLSYDAARRMFLGESPVSLSGGMLTKREAHQWCLDGAPSDIARWLAEYLGVPPHRSIRVVRWLAHCRQSGRWDALERQRRIRIPGRREPRTYSALQVLDEIQDEDIITGRDSVDAVLRRAAERLGDAWIQKCLADEADLAPIPKWAWNLPRAMRLLNTAADLAREGKEMEHCVASYVRSVQRGECYILSISTRDGRSTAELSPELEVVQHRGFRNGDPPASNVRLLNAFIRRIKRGAHAYPKRAA